MKTTIITLMLLMGSFSFSQETKEETFSAGDTTVTWAVNDATALFFTLKDSAMTGTDSIYIGLRYVLSNGMELNSTISLHDLSQTTTSTFVASNIVIPGDAGTKTFVWYPGGVSGSVTTYSGSIRISRLNGVNASTPYTPNTRMVFRYTN